MAGGALSAQLLPVLGGQLGSLSEWQSSGAGLWLPFQVVAALPRSPILLLHCSPGLSSDPSADGPQPCQLGLASGLTPKSCHLAARDPLMEP